MWFPVKFSVIFRQSVKISAHFTVISKFCRFQISDTRVEDVSFSAGRKYLKPNQVSLIGRYPSEYPPIRVYRVTSSVQHQTIPVSLRPSVSRREECVRAREETLTDSACEVTFSQVKFILFELELWEIFPRQRNEPPIQNLILRRTL